MQRGGLKLVALEVVVVMKRKFWENVSLDNHNDERRLQKRTYFCCFSESRILESCLNLYCHRIRPALRQRAIQILVKVDKLESYIKKRYIVCYLV